MFSHYNMKFLLSIFLLITSSFTLFPQENCIKYFRELSIARYENHQGRTIEALKRFEMANATYPSCTEATSKFDFIKMYLKDGKQDIAYDLICEEIKKGYEIENIGYIGISKEDLGIYYSKLQLNKDSLHKVFVSQLDLDVLLFVRDMYSLDRYVPEIENVEDSILKHIRHEVFRSNIQKLRSYSEENGIIGYKELGHLQYMVNLILLHHRLDSESDKENVSQLISMYRNAIHIGNSAPEVLINLIDNMALIIDKGKPQVMGRYFDVRTKEFREFENIEIIDSLRLSIGLNTLQEMSEILGINLPDGYEKKENLNSFDSERSKHK